MPQMQTQAPPAVRATRVSNAFELAEWSGLPFLTCQKMERIVRASNDNSGQVALVWTRHWLAEDMQWEMDVVPDRWILVHNLQPGTEKSWKADGAYWIEGDIILDNSIGVDDFDVDDATFPVDVTHHGHVKEVGECWLPKSACDVIILA